MFAMDVDKAKTIAAEIHAACPCFPPDRANIRRVVRAHHIIERHTSGKAEIIRYRQSWQMVYLIPSQGIDPERAERIYSVRVAACHRHSFSHPTCTCPDWHRANRDTPDHYPVVPFICKHGVVWRLLEKYGVPVRCYSPAELCRSCRVCVAASEMRRCYLCNPHAVLTDLDTRLPVGRPISGNGWHCTLLTRSHDGVAYLEVQGVVHRVQKTSVWDEMTARGFSVSSDCVWVDVAHDIGKGVAA